MSTGRQIRQPNKSYIIEGNSRHNESIVESSSKVRWPVSFPKIKPSFRQVQPAINEPVILRFSSKALYKNECENLTFEDYKKYQPEQKKLVSINRRSQPLKKTKIIGINDRNEQENDNFSVVDKSLKQMQLEGARKKLFKKFPIVNTIFGRRNKPISLLKQSDDYEY